ncbi:MAG: hypothetical protein B7Y07_08805, partial [Halothiobacillus sp. 24-54-40]
MRGWLFKRQKKPTLAWFAKVGDQAHLNVGGDAPLFKARAYFFIRRRRTAKSGIKASINHGA